MVSAIEVPEPEPDRRRRIPIGCLAGCAGSALLLLVWLYTMRLAVFPTTSPAPDLAGVARLSKLHFPPSTRLLASYHESTMLSRESVLLAKLEMAQGELKQFIGSLPSDRTASGGGVVPAPRLGARSPQWWQPNDGRNRLAIAFDQSNQAHVELTIVRDDPERAVVYLARHRMG